MPAAPPRPPTDQERYELHKLTEQRVETLKGEFGSFVESQNQTNRELFGLIRQTGDAILGKIENIKTGFDERVNHIDGKLSEKGRVTPALFATIFSGLSVVLVLGSGYINLQISPLQKSIAEIGAAISAAAQTHNQMARDIHMHEIKTSSENATSIENRRWLEKVQDQNRAVIGELKAKFETPKT